MHVEQIQSLVSAHFDHLGGQRERIGAVIEQGIVAYLHRMKENVFEKAIEPEGDLVADEMNPMPALGHRQADLGGNHAATAKRRIAGHPDAKATAHRSRSTTSPENGTSRSKTFRLSSRIP